MSEEELKGHTNPDSYLSDRFELFECAAVPLPPGTKAPPRPAGRERTEYAPSGTEPFEVFECQAIALPPGTKAPPRPPGKERDPEPPQSKAG